MVQKFLNKHPDHPDLHINKLKKQKAEEQIKLEQENLKKEKLEQENLKQKQSEQMPEIKHVEDVEINIVDDVDYNNDNDNDNNNNNNNTKNNNENETISNIPKSKSWKPTSSKDKENSRHSSGPKLGSKAYYARQDTLSCPVVGRERLDSNTVIEEEDSLYDKEKVEKLHRSCSVDQSDGEFHDAFDYFDNEVSDADSGDRKDSNVSFASTKSQIERKNSNMSNVITMNENRKSDVRVTNNNNKEVVYKNEERFLSPINSISDDEQKGLNNNNNNN
eukprot:Pgem_evm1s13219